MSEFAISAVGLSFQYGERKALDCFDLSCEPGQFIGILGPNGGGKTTAFRILSTLARPQSGSLKIFNEDALKSPAAARRFLGVVFQSPALDKKLSVAENLTYHGALYGLRGQKLKSRISELLNRFELADRADERAENLSGGLKRRVELAKSLLHGPRLLILDEPTTGLDPLARKNLWSFLQRLRAEEGLTLLTTTHLMEEADLCDQIVFLDSGKVVLTGKPGELKKRVGGEVLTIRTVDPETLQRKIEERYGLKVNRVDSDLCVHRENAASFIPEIAQSFGTEMSALTLSKPSLEDVFIQVTGRRLLTEVEG